MLLAGSDLKLTSAVLRAFVLKKANDFDFRCSPCCFYLAIARKSEGGQVGIAVTQKVTLRQAKEAKMSHKSWLAVLTAVVVLSSLLVPAPVDASSQEIVTWTILPGQMCDCVDFRRNPIKTVDGGKIQILVENLYGYQDVIELFPEDLDPRQYSLRDPYERGVMRFAFEPLGLMQIVNQNSGWQVTDQISSWGTPWIERFIPEMIVTGDWEAAVLQVDGEYVPEDRMFWRIHGSIVEPFEPIWMCPIPDPDHPAICFAEIPMTGYDGFYIGYQYRFDTRTRYYVPAFTADIGHRVNKARLHFVPSIVR